MFKQRIQKLVNVLKEKKLYGCIIFSSDYHNSEYLVDYFKARAFMSGFDGSAGTLLVTINGSYLWTDGRYFIQAEQQLKNSDIKLMKMGTVNTPTIIEFLKNDMKESDVLAFDGRQTNCQFVKNLKENIPNINIKLDEDLVNYVWKNRPELPLNYIYELPNNICGETIEEKLQKVRSKMNNAKYHLISSLDDIAYLFNLRGSDILHTPVFLSYALISKKDAVLFIDERKVPQEVKESLESHNVTLMSYDKVYSVIKTLDDSILVDESRINFALFTCIPKNMKIYKSINPTTMMKAIKNQVEIENIYRTHIEDGIAFVNFWYDLMHSNKSFTELDVEQLLLSYRKQQPDFMDESFDPIVAYKDHAALMHYKATQKSNVQIKNKGLLLIDSGGQYMGGTTDITRTLAMGNISDIERYHTTLVLKSHIDLAKVVFLRGCQGMTLDILARKPIWDANLDYKCGTGHGIGYMLSVHEGPNSFRYGGSSTELKEGMITTNEPGIYIEGSHGIRLENEMLTVFSHENEWGQFLKFEPLTFVPFDIDCIDVSMLDKEEINWLNNYHQMVYETLKEHVNTDVRKWLRQKTAKVGV